MKTIHEKTLTEMKELVKNLVEYQTKNSNNISNNVDKITILEMQSGYPFFKFIINII